jgi:hypothetical protein
MDGSPWRGWLSLLCPMNKYKGVPEPPDGTNVAHYWLVTGDGIPQIDR